MKMYKNYFKRLIDILASFSVLLFLAPLILVVALIIKLQDEGPVFFIQERVGKGTCNFRIYKFRSMPLSTPNVESKELNHIKITNFGKFIRRTNINELPQLINILKGDMSLIGPRPCLPSQKELINLRLRGKAYDCKPGLTGLAQVMAYNNMPNEEKADWDNQYALHITFVNDMKIILKTFSYLMKEPPTY